MSNHSRSRRVFLLSMPLMILLPHDPAWAQVTTLVRLEKLGEALGAAAEAIQKIGDSIAHLVQLGANGIDEVSARHTRSRLRDIAARLVYYNHNTNRRVASSLRSYLDLYERRGNSPPRFMPSDGEIHSWRNVMRNVREALPQVLNLLDHLKTDRSDWVLEPAYGILIETLSSRSELLVELSFHPPPSSNEEMAALRRASDQYEKLRESLTIAIGHFSAYLKEQQ